jgi:hypothetical protein
MLYYLLNEMILNGFYLLLLLKYISVAIQGAK